MILILSHEQDAHGKFMEEKLKARGQDVATLDYSKFPTELKISIKHSHDEKAITIEWPDKRQIDHGQITSILNRRQKPPVPPKGIQSKQVKEYIVGESQFFLDSLPYVIDAFWVSHPDDINRAAKKPFQLRVAKQLGFNVPPTLISNSPQEIKKFNTRDGVLWPRDSYP